MATMARSWASRAKAVLPPHYYEGFLEKKNPSDQDYKKYWAGLWGTTVYFYATSRQSQYIEKIDLADFVSLAEEDCPRAAEKSHLTLKMKNQEVKLRMESLESQQMWKGFILTIAEMKVPSNLALLPGHIYMLSEALEKEKVRRSKLDLTVQREEKLPDCFFKVSRTEAEVLLDKNEGCGNMLLRPGGDGKSVSLTVRQKANGTVFIKHYKINVVAGEYIIDVDEPYRCSSLAGVIDFFITQSKRVLVPLILDRSYALALEFMKTDEESGESTPVCARLPSGPPRPPKGVLMGESTTVSPRHRPSPPPPLPPILPIPPPRLASAPLPENVYEEEDPLEQTYVNEGGAVWVQPGALEENPKGSPKGVLRPPIRAAKPPKPGSLAVGKSTNQPALRQMSEGAPSRQAKSLPRSFTIGMSEELERKLQERRAKLED